MSYITRRPQTGKLRTKQDFTYRRGLPSVSRARAFGYDDWYDTGGPDQITIHEAEDGPQFTGLYDAHGNELCRIADKLPMGFRLK